MNPRGLTTQAPGSVQDFIKWGPVLARVGPRSLRIKFFPMPEYFGRWWGIYINGVLRRPLVYSSPGEIVTAIRQLDPDESEAYVWLEDFGLWSDIDDTQDPYHQAREQEGPISTKISFSWTAPTSLTSTGNFVSTGQGDTQLTAFTITGAKRKANVAEVQDSPTRGRLWYSITNNAGTYIVRFWNQATLVAEGSRSGNGSVTCTEKNQSGLSVTCTVTFTGEVAHGDAYIELMWPEYYDLHWTTGTLSFPRVADAVVFDTGKDEFSFVTPALSSGTYKGAILPTRDGVVQSSGISTTTGIVINDAPSPVDNQAASGNAAATTVSWTVGESGCTFTVYYSKINEPINWGHFATPAPIVTGLDATSQALAAITGYPGFVNVIIRATKSGTQEKTDEQLTIEYDSTGAIVGARPNRASITKITQTHAALLFSLEVQGIVLSAEKQAAATYLYLFIKPSGTPLDFTTYQARVALPTAVNGVQRGTINYTIASGSVDGWYHMAVRAVTAGGVLSPVYGERYVYMTNDAPGAASNISIEPLRGEKS